MTAHAVFACIARFYSHRSIEEKGERRRSSHRAASAGINATWRVAFSCSRWFVSGWYIWHLPDAKLRLAVILSGGAMFISTGKTSKPCNCMADKREYFCPSFDDEKHGEMDKFWFGIIGGNAGCEVEIIFTPLVGTGFQEWLAPLGLWNHLLRCIWQPEVGVHLV